jgi:hypothetical protein
MDIYCLPDFKSAVDKLSKKKSYNSIEQEIINYFFNKNVEDVLSGTRLNNSITEPYIKKRLHGDGGFRFYYLVIIANKTVYLMFVHPKTGSEGSDNITDESKSKIYKDVLQAIKSKNLFKVEIQENTLVYTPIK